MNSKLIFFSTQIENQRKLNLFLKKLEILHEYLWDKKIITERIENNTNEHVQGKHFIMQ